MRLTPHCASCRSAPLPIKVDGFSMGAVMGYSEQHTLLLMTSDEEVETFLNVSRGSCTALLVSRPQPLLLSLLLPRQAHAQQCW